MERKFPVVQMYSETLKFISRFWYINNEQSGQSLCIIFVPIIMNGLNFPSYTL